MASKNIHVTVPDWLYERALGKYLPLSNVSQHIQELLQLGIEAKEKEQAEKLKRSSAATPDNAGVAQPGYSQTIFLDEGSACY